MTEFVALDAQRSVPEHVPADLIYDYPLTIASKTTENPFDRIIPELAAGPIAFYARAAVPTGGDAWVFRRAEDLRAIYKDTENFTARGWTNLSALIGENWFMAPVEYDPPEHGPLRALVNPLLAPQRMLALDAKVREYARGYIDRFKDRGECELMSEFAFKFPIAVFVELMGLPHEDVDQLLVWEDGLLHEPDYSKIVQATRAVHDYLVEKLEERRRNPKDDFLSALANAKIDGRPITLDEQIGLAFNLYTGGLDTVSTNIGLHFRHLAENQEHQTYLREQPEQIPLATEELLRAYAPVSSFRICVKETEIAGVRVMPGDRIVMNTTLACRDEQKYENPHEVRLDRGPQHEAFGFGFHRCVGMHLARRELHCALEEFMKAIPQFRIPQGATIVSKLGPMIQPETLPLVWSVASA